MVRICDYALILCIASNHWLLSLVSKRQDNALAFMPLQEIAYTIVIAGMRKKSRRQRGIESFMPFRRVGNSDSLV